jgi:hypothetical protein
MAAQLVASRVVLSSTELVSYLVINKFVTHVKFSNLSAHFLCNRSTLDIDDSGYIGMLQHKKHPRELWHIPLGTSWIYAGPLPRHGRAVWALRCTPTSPQTRHETTKLQTCKHYITFRGNSASISNETSAGRSSHYILSGWRDSPCVLVKEVNKLISSFVVTIPLELSISQSS